ncbi:hypothetical protein PG984_001370 [Apiospora sp. TS-2023a]
MKTLSWLFTLTIAGYAVALPIGHTGHSEINRKRAIADADEAVGNLWNSVVVDEVETPRGKRAAADADEAVGNLWNSVVADKIEERA